MRSSRWISALVVGLFLLIVGHAGAVQHPAQPLIVCFGDSITAGYGLSSGEAYPDALENLLHKHGFNYHVNNQGVSGATTKDAMNGVQSVIRLNPDAVVVEFGGNDGLRGLRIENTTNNLDAVLTTFDAAHIPVVLAGITLPPDYGKDYIAAFEKMYRELAAKHHAAFIPMIYRDLAHKPGMIQADGIHPTADGSIAIAKTVAEVLEPMLKKAGTKGLRD
jgi:acyl-CoA thioesterase-1